MPVSRKRNIQGSRSGLGIDFEGGPVIDPTENVKSLSEAANRRQDDLRNSSEKYHEALSLAERKLNEVVAKHAEDMAALRASHAQELADKEASRLNAIRQVDQLAVTTAAQQTLTAVNTLATTAARDAETLRNALTNTATTIAAQTAGIVTGITERISALEKSSYMGAGRQAYADTAMAELVIEMKRLSAARDTTTGKTEGINAAWVALGGVVTLILGLLATGAYMFAGKSSTATSPQIIYAVPPPATTK